ncbi:hypothetical protein DINM_005783 [Dirofilaria immitis]|nr:hypothetical protein [Dirofilaria immitis]
MRRICSKFAAVQTSSRFCSATAGTNKKSVKDQKSTSTYTVIHRKNERRKPADTLSPLKISHGPKQTSDFEETDDGMFEDDDDVDEDIGWTSSFLRSKFNESKLCQKEYNHYEGMRYPPGDIQLVSQYWVKSKYKNDWFTIYPVTKKNPSFNRDEAFSWDENVNLLDPVIVENIRKLNFRMPTVIQRRAFRAFKSDAHLLIAAETGSGKTVAYAAPLLSNLLHTVDRRTKGVVLVPTHALRMQTSLMISKLAEGTDIKVIGGSENWRSEKLKSEEDWNILVSTPSFPPDFFTTLNIDYIVLDEADMLLDDSFLNSITGLLSRLKIRHSVIDKNATDGIRLIFSSATYPDELQRIAESIVDYEYLYCDLKNVNLVSNSLREVGIEHTSLRGGRRIERLIDDLHSGIVRTIIATDVASRGLDLPQLRHIINYDFPRQISDYVHRCGRIGRIGSLHKCLMTSFVRRAWEVKHVNSVELAARLHRPLKDVELNDPARLTGLQRDLIS